MPDWSAVALLLVAAVTLLLTPRPVVLSTVLAVGLGDRCHVVAATLGRSALLASSAAAFTVVKYADAASLVYLGGRTLLGRARHPQAGGAAGPAAYSRIFSHGFVVSLLNPKTALFFLACLPQFVDAARGSVAGQIFFFGALFVVMGCATHRAYACLAGTRRAWLDGSGRFRRLQRSLPGGVDSGLGVATALAGTEGA